MLTINFTILDKWNILGDNIDILAKLVATSSMAFLPYDLSKIDEIIKMKQDYEKEENKI